MKNWILLLFLIFTLTSCEDVITVDLNEMEAKLVIDASINISKEDGLPFRSGIRITETTGFFNNNIPIVADAEVRISSNEKDVTFHHIQDGWYEALFIPERNVEYRLIVIHKGDTYTSKASFISVPPIERIEQKEDGGFMGDQIALKAFFHDPGDEENYYFMVTESEPGVRRDVLSDEFFNGNEIFSYYSNKDLKPGNDVKFHLFGTTRSFFNYMSLLLEQVNNGGPFNTYPATVRGNIVNETNPDHFAFGYFRISEVSIKNYTVK